MKLIKKNEDGSSVLEITPREQMIIHNVGVEFTSGLYKLSNWDEPLFHCTRKEATKVFDDLTEALAATQ